MKPKYNTVRFRNVFIGATSAIFICLSGAASAADWTGAVSTDWEAFGNWTGVVGYAGSNANVSSIPANIATITTDFAFSPVDIFVGNGVGLSGRVDHKSGLAKTGSGNWMFVGRAGATGTYNMADTTTPAPGISGFAQGTGNLNVGGRLYVGGFDTGAGVGTFNMNTTGILNAPAEFHVGHGTGDGVFNLQSGTINCGLTVIGQGTGSEGILKIASGTMTINGEMWLSNSGGATGTLEFSGGQININNWVAIGRSGGNGVVNMTGGTWIKTGGSTTNFAVNANGASGTMTMSGGEVDVQTGKTLVPEGGTGTLSLSNDAVFRTGDLVVANNGGSTGNLNLNGGTLWLNQLIGGGGTENVVFNGTQLIAKVASTTFINALTNATITGGLLVDSNGFNLTVPQLLGGAGGLVKTGVTTLNLTAANTYAGPTSIVEGRLLTTTASDATGAITLSDFTGFGLTQTAIDEVYSTSAITFGSSDTTLDLNLGNFAGTTASAPLNVTGPAGSLTLDGDVTVNIVDTNIAAAVIPLISYNGLQAGTGTFVLGTLPDGVVATLLPSDVAGPSLLSLDVTRANDPYWTGTTNALWNTTDANWVNEYGAVATNFANGDPAMFDDRVLTGPTAIDLSGTVSPGGSGVTFNNSTYGYTLTGTGKISGSTGLLKLGSNSLTLSTANDYEGATTLTAGTLNANLLANAGFASSVGSNDNLILNGGTLNYTGAATTIDRGFSVTGSNSTISTATDLTLDGPVSSPGGSFVKLGGGNLTLNNDSINLGGSGQVNKVNGGTLSLLGAGTQIVSIPGELWVGSATSAAGHLVLQDNTLTVGSWLTLGRGNGDTGILSTITADGSVIQSGNFSTGFNGDLPTNNSVQTIALNDTSWTNNGQSLFAESQNATTTLGLTGASSFTSTGPVRMALGPNSACNLTLSGTSSFTGNAQVQMAINGTSTCNVTIQDDAAMTGGGGWFSIGDNGTGVMTVKGNGTLTVGNIDFNISDVGTSNGTLNIQGNATVSASGVVFVGKNTGTTGTVTMDAGTFNTVTYISIARRPGSTGVFNMNGGTVNQTDPGAGISVGENGTGTLNMNAGSINVGGGGLYLTAETVGTGVAVVNLNGGTVTAKRVAERDFTLTNQSTLNFDGGLLMAGTGAELNFIGNLDFANVKSGGAKIDTNSQTIAINQPLLDGTGGGGLIKSGDGFLQLNGVNTYTGTTSVTAGSLGGTGSVAGTLAVSAAGTLAPGVGVGTFSAGASTIAGTYACEIAGSTADKLVANGTLDVSAAALVVTELSPVSASPLVIASYTGATPAPFASVTGLPSGFSVVYDHGGNQIALVGPVSAYNSWAAANITAIDPLADASSGGDPDNDGLTNASEFALNGNPLSGAASGKVRGIVAPVGGSPTLVLTLPVRTGASFSGSTEQVSGLIDGLIYTIQGSDQLTTWDLVISEVTGTDKTAIESTMPPQGSVDWTYRTFQSPGTTTADPADFLRAVITTP